MRMRLIVIIGVLLAIAAGAGVVFLRSRVPVKTDNEVTLPVQSESEHSLLKEVLKLEKKPDLIGLKAAYQRLISEFANNKDAGIWQKKLDEINIKIISSPVILAGLSAEYVIQPGDTLTKISKQFKTTIELLKKSNNLSGDNIRPGQRLKVWTGKFSVLIDKSQNTLMLKCNDEIIKTYIAATGANNSTPVGVTKISNKLINPVWYKERAVVPAGSPENILGTRWLGFESFPGYGIHGTTEPESMGKQVTAGCVRMINPDVEELYSLLPIGVEVTITD